MDTIFGQAEAIAAPCAGYARLVAPIVLNGLINWIVSQGVVETLAAALADRIVLTPCEVGEIINAGLSPA